METETIQTEVTTEANQAKPEIVTTETPTNQQPEQPEAKTIDYEKLYKEQIKKAEKEKIEQQKKNNEYKELYEKAEKDLEDLKPKAEKLETLEKQIKLELLNQLPKEKQKQFENLDIETLKNIVDIAKISNLQNTVLQGAGAQGKTDELNESEFDSYFETNIKDGKIIDRSEHKKIVDRILKNGIKAKIIND